MISSFLELDQAFKDLWKNFSLTRAQELYDERYTRGWLSHNLPWGIYEEDPLVSEEDRLKCRLVLDYVELTLALDRHGPPKPRVSDADVAKERKRLELDWKKRGRCGQPRHSW